MTFLLPQLCCKLLTIEPLCWSGARYPTNMSFQLIETHLDPLLLFARIMASTTSLPRLQRTTTSSVCFVDFGTSALFLFQWERKLRLCCRSFAGNNWLLSHYAGPALATPPIRGAFNLSKFALTHSCCSLESWHSTTSLPRSQRTTTSSVCFVGVGTSALLLFRRERAQIMVVLNWRLYRNDANVTPPYIIMNITLKWEVDKSFV